MGFQGSVESFSLADVFQNLAMNKQTGTLCVFIQSGPSRHIFFESGQVKFLSHGQQKPLLLGEILIGRGIATEEQVQEALAQQDETKEPIGKCLLNLGYIESERLDELVTRQIEEEIYDLFGWEKAQFEFTDGPPPKDLFGEQVAGRGASIPIASLIMEAARRVDEWDQLKQQIPSFKEIYRLNESVEDAVRSGELEVNAVEKRLLNLADGTRDVEDLIQDSFLFRFEILQALTSLTKASMVRPTNAEELKAASETLKEQGNRYRFCKVLERRLAVGDESQELRRALANTLAEESQNEKAVIHFSVLAEAELQAGREDEGVTLLKRILQIMPHHLNSRSRLGAIYAKRGQNREAVIQYQELVTAYRANEQLTEARATCQRALECEPDNINMRQELINIYIAEGEKEHAARNYEFLGDQLAKNNQVRPAAEAYRKAMQISQGMTHLKKKLANILLTQEDRRARTKRTMVVTTAGLIAAIVITLVVLREYRIHSKYTKAKAHANEFVLEAEDDMVKGDRDMEKSQTDIAAKKFKAAEKGFNKAFKIFASTGLIDAWAPFTGVNELTEDDIEHFRNREAAALSKYRDAIENGKRDCLKKLAEAQETFQKQDFYEAQKQIRTVLKHPFLTPEIKEKAEITLTSTNALLQKLETGLDRINRNAFASTQEEWIFKKTFLPEFSTVLAQANVSIQFPVEIFLELTDVSVSLNKKTRGLASRSRKNVFRYDPKKPNVFTFTKNGYKTVTKKTQSLEWSLKIQMSREPSNTIDLNESLSGTAYYDGKWLWVGTASGSILKLDPNKLQPKPLWKFNFPGPTKGGLGKRVFGRIYPSKDLAGKPMLIYGTKEGDLIGMYPDQKKAAWIVKGDPGKTTRMPPVLMDIDYGKKKFMVICTGNKVHAYTATLGLPLAKVPQAFIAPSPITTSPVCSSDRSTIIFGCANGHVYGIKAAGGKLQFEWTTKAPSIMGTPIVTDKAILASSSDGKLYVFGVKGGHTFNFVRLGGPMTTSPVSKNNLLLFGTSSESGFYGINLNRQTVAFKFEKERIDGDVTVAPAIANDRIYYGTDRGHFYALEKRGNTYQLQWSYKPPNRRSGVVSAPIIIGNKVLFITANGQIFIFEE